MWKNQEFYGEKQRKKEKNRIKQDKNLEKQSLKCKVEGSGENKNKKMCSFLRTKYCGMAEVSGFIFINHVKKRAGFYALN